MLTGTRDDDFEEFLSGANHDDLFEYCESANQKIKIQSEEIRLLRNCINAFENALPDPPKPGDWLHRELDALLSFDAGNI